MGDEDEWVQSGEVTVTVPIEWFEDVPHDARRLALALLHWSATEQVNPRDKRRSQWTMADDAANEVLKVLEYLDGIEPF